jgi:hypothetical protein
MSGKIRRHLLILSVLLLTGDPGIARAEERISVGAVEDVILLPWKVLLPARIDSGARFSSLDARELKIVDNRVEFRLPEKYGGRELRLPVVDWQTVRSAEATEKRPVVEIEICFGRKTIQGKFNLNDRSAVRYPVLIGRDILRKHFIVDPQKNRLIPPTCPEEAAR